MQPIIPPFSKIISMYVEAKWPWIHFGALTLLLLGFAMGDLFGTTPVQVSVPPVVCVI